MKVEKLSKEKQKEMLGDLERFRQDIDWVEANTLELFKQYPEEWVMVYNKTIVGHGKDLQLLCNRMCKEGKYDPGHCAGQFITNKPKPYFIFNMSGKKENKP